MAKRSCYTTFGLCGLYFRKHEERLVAKIEAQQAERAARKAELVNKIDAFKGKTKRSIENFNNGVKNVIHIFGFQRRTPQKLGYEK